MKLSMGARRDNLQVFVGVPALQLYCMQLFAPVNSNTNFLKKTKRCGQDQKIIKLVKMTSQSWSWGNITWGSWQGRT